MFWSIFGLITGVKLLFLPAYRSTDFEMHRNWLAITHSLPISKWYMDATSEWTLDYPPIFAYFEFVLSHIAKYFDENMLKVENLNYQSNKTILFQRVSVVVADIVYAIGSKKCLEQLLPNISKQKILATVLLGNFGLLIIDHIHFQYNGILFGIFLLSIGYMYEEKFLKSAFYFAILLNMKHIFVYVSPVYMYFLKEYCWQRKSLAIIITNLMKLASITLGVTALSFAPFIHQLPQVISRLFPFKRGLCHAYWAPNFWAIYNIADKAAVFITKRAANSSSNTGGLVQEYRHQVLPEILPITTFVITIVAMMPCIFKIFFAKSDGSLHKSNFIRGIVICGCTSFLFGWHVHEKAILMTVIPLSILMASSESDAKHVLFLSIVSHFSLFPLLFKPNLALIKISLLLTYILVQFNGIKQLWPSVNRKNILSLHEIIYSFGLVALLLYEFLFQHVLGLDKRLPFLPLLLTSVYCSIGIMYFWLRYYAEFLFDRKSNEKIQRN